MQLKRLWDTTTKQIVFVEGPTGHQCQLWVDESTDKMYYYDMSQWLEYTQSAVADGRTYWPTWKVVDSDDEMWVYDTNEATELFTWESGDKVSYVFKDWDGTVLKEWKVKEWTKPTAPADPTRAATAQYTYTFAGWNPTVEKITKKTTYIATYTSTVNEYTVTIASNDVSYGTVDENSLTVAYGTAISASDNVLTIGETEVTATAETGYVFSSWWVLPATVTWNLTITATFEAESYTLTINVENLPEGADITWEITDLATSETLEEISVSSFPMAIDIIWGLWLNCNSHGWDWDITIDSLNEDLDGIKQYQINISCNWYKPLFETVWFDLEDGWDWTYYGEVGPGSNVSTTISFTPVENPAE